MTLREKIFNNKERIAEIYGTFITLGLIVYFLLMYIAGLAHVTELRFFNLLIQTVGIYYAIQQYKKTHHGHINYFRSMVTGVASSFIASSTFTLFVFIFLKLNTPFMEALKIQAPLGEYLDPYIASFSIWFEGIFSGFTGTFILVNFLGVKEDAKRG